MSRMFQAGPQGTWPGRCIVDEDAHSYTYHPRYPLIETLSTPYPFITSLSQLIDSRKWQESIDPALLFEEGF